MDLPSPKQCMLPLVVAIYRKKHSCFAIFRNTRNNKTTETPWEKKCNHAKVTGPKIHSLFIRTNMQPPQVIIKHRVGIYYSFKYCVTYLGYTTPLNTV